jgi:hypothetical protein
MASSDTLFAEKGSNFPLANSFCILGPDTSSSPTTHLVLHRPEYLWAFYSLSKTLRLCVKRVTIAVDLGTGVYYDTPSFYRILRM